MKPEPSSLDSQWLLIRDYFESTRVYLVSLDCYGLRGLLPSSLKQKPFDGSRIVSLTAMYAAIKGKTRAAVIPTPFFIEDSEVGPQRKHVHGANISVVRMHKPFPSAFSLPVPTAEARDQT